VPESAKATCTPRNTSTNIASSMNSGRYSLTRCFHDRIERGRP
jgi:hypothetical protein